jgi:hypothetical protein
VSSAVFFSFAKEVVNIPARRREITMILFMIGY